MNLGVQGPDDHGKDFVAPPFEPVLDDEVLDKDERENQRRTMARDVLSQSAGLDPAARHGIHRVPGAAPISASELDRERAEDLSASRLLSFRGRPLLAADGSEIGTISDVYLDESTGIPEWLGARLGSLMGSPRVVAPVFGAYVLVDAISVPYARELVVSAVVAGGQISADDERGLYAHFSVPMSHDRSSTGLPAGLDMPPPSRLRRWIGAIPIPGRRRVAPIAASAIGASIADGAKAGARV